MHVHALIIRHADIFVRFLTPGIQSNMPYAITSDVIQFYCPNRRVFSNRGRGAESPKVKRQNEVLPQDFLSLCFISQLYQFRPKALFKRQPCPTETTYSYGRKARMSLTWQLAYFCTVGGFLPHQQKILIWTQRTNA